ncbi:major facilitator superfamily domain-containing protein [Infundibulicybe gibba]|nr:major facilitator superfamily domain-containing protein [Infundibulicybe gibba]
MQFILGVCGLVGFTSIYLCFPETSQPNTRGIDKWRSGAGSKIGWPKFVFLNPLEPLRLLRNPNMMAVSIASSVVLLTDLVMLVPLAYTIGERYQIKNDAWLGACFLPIGIGNSIGSPIAGRISDEAIVAWRNKRGGIWYPEDRLRSTLFPSAVLVPLSVLLSGWIIRFVDGPIGLTLNLLCLFMNGVGVQMVLGLAASYLVDVMHSRSAESVAASTGFRSCMVSLAVAGILPMIDQFGVVVTNTLSAFLAWIGFGMLWCTIRYGSEMRAWSSDVEV